MFPTIDKSEKKVLLVASLVSVGHLLFVAYAAAFLGITVPTCLPNEKLFTQASMRVVGDNRFEVKYVAKMWAFEPKKITVPLGSTIDFFLSSIDVTHGFQIRDTNVNLMAVPGVINRAIHKFTVPGIYRVVCHEYCGFGHENMSAEIDVNDSVTEATMTPITGIPSSEGTAAELSELAAQGKQLYEQKGCVACHSIDGKPGVGPSLKGVWGSTIEFEDGTTSNIDEAYLAESIKEPAEKKLKGFAPVMPKIELPEQDVKALIEYIKTLK